MEAGRWTIRAACRGTGPTLYYTDALKQAAYSVCADCKVRIECLNHAVETQELGIWGGTDETTRLALHRILTHQGRVNYERAIDHVTAELGRIVHGWPDDTPPTPARPCKRCGAVTPGTPAGKSHPLDRNGPNARCGHASTYNRGCRCLPCAEAKHRSQKRSPRGERKTAMTTTEIQAAQQSFPPDIFDETALHLAPNLDQPTWTRLGESLLKIAGSHQWWVGDWLLYGEEHYGEAHAQALNPDLGVEYKTLQNWRWVSSQIPPAIRLESLSWTHHRVAAELDTLNDREEALKSADANGWTSRQLAEHVHHTQRPELEARQDPPRPTKQSMTFTLSFNLNLDDEPTGRRILNHLAGEMERQLAEAGIQPNRTSQTPSS